MPPHTEPLAGGEEASSLAAHLARAHSLKRGTFVQSVMRATPDDTSARVSASDRLGLPRGVLASPMLPVVPSGRDLNGPGITLCHSAQTGDVCPIGRESDPGRYERARFGI